MSNILMKQLDYRLTSILHIKRMIANKIINLGSDFISKLDNSEKFLKYLKKQIKDQKLTQAEIYQFCQPMFQQIDHISKLSYWEFRLQKTDFESLLLKIKYNEDLQTKKKISIQQITGFHRKKEPQLLINCKDTLLLQLRNQAQNFDISTLIDKTHQILQQIPFAKNLDEYSYISIKEVIKQICKGYNIVPYHNFTHGFSVFLSFFCVTKISGISPFFDDFTLFFSLIACLSHDIGHEGLNTLFEVKTNSHLSNLFGKFTVMEKMHLAKTLQILTKNQSTNKIYESLSAEQKKKSREVVARSILATDMSKHFDYVASIKDSGMDSSLKQDRDLLMETLVHACDIENPSYQFESYMYWAHLVCIQFHDQTVRQKQCNAQITDYLKFDTLTYFFKNQSNFANTIVLPLWISLEQVVPDLASMQVSKKIKKNMLVLSEALRRNTEPVLVHQSFLKFVSNQLEN